MVLLLVAFCRNTMYFMGLEKKGLQYSEASFYSLFFALFFTLRSLRDKFFSGES